MLKVTWEKLNFKDKIIGFCVDNCPTNFGNVDRDNGRLNVCSITRSVSLFISWHWLPSTRVSQHTKRRLFNCFAVWHRKCTGVNFRTILFINKTNRELKQFCDEAVFLLECEFENNGNKYTYKSYDENFSMNNKNLFGLINYNCCNHTGVLHFSKKYQRNNMHRYKCVFQRNLQYQTGKGAENRTE